MSSNDRYRKGTNMTDTTPEPADSKAPQPQSQSLNTASFRSPFSSQHQVVLNEDIQVAHRLLNMPGKCQNIHGHSMNVSLMLSGYSNENGVFQNLDFGNMKDNFRTHLKNNYDHRLLLNKNDPWAKQLFSISLAERLQMQKAEYAIHDPEYVTELRVRSGDFDNLPGLQLCESDPTTENLCYWIYLWARYTFELPCKIIIQETKSNAVSYGDSF